MMKVIKNWRARPLRCYFCETSLGVKHEVEHDGKAVYACDKCALLKEETTMNQEINELSSLLKNIENKWDDGIFFCREKEKLPKLSHYEFYAKAILDAGYRKQSEGEWETFPSLGNKYRCSLCKAKSEKRHNFCHDCGAKMKGV